jgi:hypothetical protein
VEEDENPSEVVVESLSEREEALLALEEVVVVEYLALAVV